MAAVASVRGKGGLGPVQFVKITVGMFCMCLSLEVRYYSLKYLLPTQLNRRLFQ